MATQSDGQVANTPNHATERTKYVMELANSFEERGRDVLKRTREDEPEKFWLFVSGVMRRDEALQLAARLSDEALDAAVNRVVAGLRKGTLDEGKGRRDHGR